MLEPTNRNGGGRRTRGMREFMEFVDSKGLRNLPIGGLRYTWSNMQERPKLNKLDRFFLSADWDMVNLFPGHHQIMFLFLTCNMLMTL